MPIKYSDYRKNTPEILEERRKLAEYNKQFPTESTVKKNSTFGDTTAYLAGKFLSALTSGFEGQADAIAPTLKSIGQITSLMLDNPIGRIIDKDIGDYEANPIYQLGETLQRDNVGETLSNVVTEEFGARSKFDDNDFVTKATAAAGRLLSYTPYAGTKSIINVPTINKTGKLATAANTMLQGLNNPTTQAFVMDMFGSSYNEALQNNASNEEAGLYALLNTGKEAGIELLSGGLGGLFGTGPIDDYITKDLVNIAKTKLGKMAIKFGTGVIGEGLEEVLSDLVTPFVDYVYKHELDFSSYNNLLEDFFLGAAVSGVFQGGKIAYDKVLNPSVSVYESVMGEYIDNIQSEIDTYTEIEQDVTNIIENSTDPNEIVESNEVKEELRSYLQDLSEKMDRINQYSTASLKNTTDAPDVLKIIPDTTETTRVDDKTIASEYKSPTVKTIKLGDASYDVKDIEVDSYNGIKSKQMQLVNNKTNLVEGYVKYNVDANNDIHVEDIRTFDEYKNQGIGRQLAVELQNIAGNKDIYFDTLTDDGANFWPKVATLTEYKKGATGVSYYKGRVNNANTEKKTAAAKKTEKTKTVSDKKETSTKKQSSTEKKTADEKKRGTITKEQIKTIHTLLGKNGKLKEQVYEEFGIESSVELSKEEAAKLIDKLKGTKTKTQSEKIESTAEQNIQTVKLKNITAGTKIEGVADEKILNKIDSENYKKTNRVSKDYLIHKIIDSAHAIDKLADAIKKTNPKVAENLRAANDRRFNAFNIAHHQEFDYQSDYKTGVKIGKSINEILQPFTDEGALKDFETYVVIKSNLERIKNNKGITLKDSKGNKLTIEQQEDFIKRMDVLHPEFKAGQKEVTNYYKNLLKQEVGGRVDQELANYLFEKYDNYVRFYNANANSMYLKGDKIMVAKAVKTAKGGNYDLSPLRESMVRATNASVSGVLENNLRLQLLRCLGGTQLKLTKDYQPILNTDDGWMIVAYDNGIPYGIKVNKDIVDAMRLPGITELEESLGKWLKLPKMAAEVRRKILTEMDPFFSFKDNPIKDLQDMLINSKHARKTTGNLLKAFGELKNNGDIAQQYKALGGFASSYFGFDGKKHKGLIARARRWTQIVEQTIRLAEFMASVEEGRTLEQAMYDAAEVTTNFKRGGEWTKALDRNGFTFLNASVQGMYKQYRNLKGVNGVKGYVELLAKTVGLGIATAAVNEFFYGDDEDYQNLPDYIKDQYYLIKVKGKFIKIPKGRVISIFNKAARNVNDIIKGTDNQFHALKLIQFAYEQTGPNNPIDENILAPIFQAINNKKWTGDPIDNKYETDKSGSSYKLPKDRVAKNTSSVAKFIAGLFPEEFNISPKKIDYIIDQYSGYVGDILKPGVTETEEYESIVENPIASEFLIDTVYSNKNISEVYDLVGPLKIQANKSGDVNDELRYKYVNSQLYQINSLYGEIRDYVKEHPHDNAKKVREYTDQINEIANETINKYKSIKAETIMHDGKEYIMSDGVAYKYDKNGTLRKCTSKVCKEILNSK